MSTRRKFLSAPLGIADQPRPAGRHATSRPRSGLPPLAVAMRLDVVEQVAVAAGLTRVHGDNLLGVDGGGEALQVGDRRVAGAVQQAQRDVTLFEPSSKLEAGGLVEIPGPHRPDGFGAVEAAGAAELGGHRAAERHDQLAGERRELLGEEALVADAARAVKLTGVLDANA